jgi:urease accessory protein
VFKTIPVVDAVYRADTLPDVARGFSRHSIVLGWEDRLKTRGRRRSDAGLEFGTALPRGTVMREGDRLVVESAQVVIEVVERSEPVYVIEPRTPQEWGLFAYHIGNGHQPLMVTDRALVCPEVPGVEMLLHYHGIPYVRAEKPFTPTTAAGHVAT